MSEQDWLAQRFEEHRRRLRAVAYRMLGSVSEAEDAVQEAWLRLSGSEPGGIENLSGWLTTVVARVSLNMLRSRAVRREEPLSPRLPDPIVDRADAVDPEHEALLADSVGLALLVVLDTLTPCSPSRSRRSPRSSTAPRRRHASWPAGPGAASVPGPPPRTRT